MKALPQEIRIVTQTDLFGGPQAGALPNAASLFDMDGDDDRDIEDLIGESVAALADLMLRCPPALASSFGKDSSISLALACAALVSLQQKSGKKEHPLPWPLTVLHGDVRSETPAVRMLADRMIRDLEAWAASENLDIRMVIYKPSLPQAFAVNVLSGSRLPTFAHHRRRNCTSALKLKPAEAAMRALERAYGERPVVIVGSRFAESRTRAGNMEKHGMQPRAVTESAGRLTFAPIADWSTQDVFGALAMAGTGQAFLPVWRPDFRDLTELYRDALGGECPVLAPVGKQGKTGCGSRFGCHHCLLSGNHHHLKPMLEDPKYAHLTDLNRIRNWMGSLAYRYDMHSWLTHDIVEDDAGNHWVRIQPDTLSAEALEMLTLAYLTADKREYDRAKAFDEALKAGRLPEHPVIDAFRAAGREPDMEYLEKLREPTFRVITPDQLIALDFYAASRGLYAKPHHVLELHHRVWQLGEEFDVPDPQPGPTGNVPPPRWLPLSDFKPGAGMQSLHAMIWKECFNNVELHQDKRSGETILSQIADTMDISDQVAAWTADVYYPADLRLDHQNPLHGFGRTIRNYLELGTVALSAGGKAGIHNILRLREGLVQTLGYSPSYAHLYAQAQVRFDLDRKANANQDLFPETLAEAA